MSADESVSEERSSLLDLLDVDSIKSLNKSIFSFIPEDRVSDIIAKWKSNVMLIPYIAKVTVNIGVGESGEKLQKAAELLESLTGSKPVYRRAKRTIRDFGIRKGENIAVMVTLRKGKAEEFLEKVFEGVGRRIKYSSFDMYGNFSLGIREHLVLPGTKYDPEIGIFGMDVSVTIERKGYRVLRRKIKRSSIPRRHRVDRDEGALFLALKYNLILE